MQPTQHVAIVAQFGNSIAVFLSPPPLDLGFLTPVPLIMSGNKSFFSQLTYLDSLPSVTMANGSQIKVHGIGQTRPSSNLTLSMLYH